MIFLYHAEVCFFFLCLFFFSFFVHISFHIVCDIIKLSQKNIPSLFLCSVLCDSLLFLSYLYLYTLFFFVLISSSFSLQDFCLLKNNVPSCLFPLFVPLVLFSPILYFHLFISPPSTALSLHSSFSFS